MNHVHHVTPSLYAASGVRKYVNFSERSALLACLSSLPISLRLFILTLVWSGARITEVLSVTAQNIELESCILAIQTLKRRRFVMREIPIPPDLVIELDRCFDLQHRQREPLLANARLWEFHRVTGWRLIKSAMQSAGIHGVRASPKGLRHAYGVLALAAGVPLNIVQLLLGHSSIKTTTVYTEASGPDLRAIVEKCWTYEPAVRPATMGAKRRIPNSSDE